jgi:hypothetical protein
MNHVEAAAELLGQLPPYFSFDLSLNLHGSTTAGIERLMCSVVEIHCGDYSAEFDADGYDFTQPVADAIAKARQRMATDHTDDTDSRKSVRRIGD